MYLRAFILSHITLVFCNLWYFDISYCISSIFTIMAFSHSQVNCFTKTYAQAAAGKLLSVHESWAHIQTEDQEEALTRAVQNSMENTQVV